MTKTMFMLLLAATSTGAMAEWTKLWGNDVLDAYVDGNSIRKKGNNVVTHNMFDLKKAAEYDGNEYRSSVLLYEFDCTKERSRSLESIFYAENHGTGAIVDSGTTPYAWTLVLPATPLNSFMNYACEKGSHQSQGLK